MENSSERTLSRKYESLDYDLIENVIHLEHQHKSRLNNFINRDLQRWVAIFLIGFFTALAGFFASFSVNILTHRKFTQIINIAEDQCRHNGTESLTYVQLIECMSIPYLLWLAWNVLPSLFGCLLVTYIAPVAAGSGIPVVKCYLNGVSIPEVVQFKTFLTKLLGVISSVVGGLAVGKEGPFIHCGAAIGAGVSQGKSTTFKYDLKLFRSFRNDRDKRDFVSAGASAGVAAAFGAPIGGVLFALEEGASFWNQALTWRIFFCSMMTSFILNLLTAGYNEGVGMLSFHSLVNFGLVEELDYLWSEVPIYICIAMLGGAIGASFCYVNLVITRLRKRFLTKNYLKVLELVCVAVLSATAGVVLILFASECRKLPPEHVSERYDIEPANQTITKTLWQSSLNLFTTRATPSKQVLSYNADDQITKALKNHIVTFTCPPGEYSAMSSLWLKTSEGASSTFMVLQDDIWSIKTLALFLFVYYWLAVITYGTSVSSGVFIPSLLIGATTGRLIGMILKYFIGPSEWLMRTNKFAIIGAASVLGGVVRMTISLTVIMIEATGCISFGLPIMICLMVSKWVADSFIEGLYDLAIHQANVPFLDWEPPMKSYSIYASDAMSHDVKVVRTTETVANLISILKSTTHNGFPVVDYDSQPYGDMGIEHTSKPRSAHEVRRRDKTDQTIDGASVSAPDTGVLVDEMHDEIEPDEDCLAGSFQRCSITAKRESYGRFRGLILRWQLLVMLDLKIFNENERSYEQLNLQAFQKSYPRCPSLEKVVSGLTDAMYDYHLDLRSIMNPSSYTVHYSASFPRIYHLFRSLGLRHLVVIDDRNQVVGMITRKDLARYVRTRDEDGLFRFRELQYSS